MVFFLKSKKGQIFIYEIFIVLVIVLTIIFLEITIINNHLQEIEKKQKNLKILEEILLVEEIISDCDFLAVKKNKICYKNLISFTKKIDYKKYNISKLFLEKEIFTNQKSNRCYKRGVVYNNSFKILEVCYE